MKNAFREAMEDCPIIAAVKDKEGLEECLTTESRIVFILFGDILSITGIVDTLKQHNKTAMVHIDLIAGLTSREVSVDYIKNNTKADGIITTKPALVKRAKEVGLYSVLRFFVIDSMAYENIQKQCSISRPDCIEILPGIMPKVIRKISRASGIPLIAGGLIEDREDIFHALQAGAESISTTNRRVWRM